MTQVGLMMIQNGSKIRVPIQAIVLAPVMLDHHETCLGHSSKLGVQFFLSLAVRHLSWVRSRSIFHMVIAYYHQSAGLQLVCLGLLPPFILILILFLLYPSHVLLPS